MRSVLCTKKVALQGHTSRQFKHVVTVRTCRCQVGSTFFACIPFGDAFYWVFFVIATGAACVASQARACFPQLSLCFAPWHRSAARAHAISEAALVHLHQCWPRRACLHCGPNASPYQALFKRLTRAVATGRP